MDMTTEASVAHNRNELTEALGTLLGRKVLAIASLTEPIFCMALQARIMAIEEASPIEHRVTLHFGTSNALTVPLRGTVARFGSSKRRGHQAQWVELQLSGGPKIMLEEMR